MGAVCATCGPKEETEVTVSVPGVAQDEEVRLDAWGPPPEEGATAKLVAQGADVTRNDQFIREALEAHNTLRARHGAPPLTWSDHCAQKAQLAADEAVYRRQLLHVHHKEYGHSQNAFQGTAGAFGAKDAIESWYEEVDNPGYTWPGNPPAPGLGHFSQVVWKDCAEVGMAVDRQGSGFIYANYWPAGNVMGQYDKNVFKKGTPMQRRKLRRQEPYNKTVTVIDAEVQSVLDSISSDDVVQNIKSKIREGWSTTMEYKPAPDGYLKYTFRKGGAMSSGQIGVV